MHDLVSGVFVKYLGFFEGMIWGFTKNRDGSTVISWSMDKVQSSGSAEAHLRRLAPGQLSFKPRRNVAAAASCGQHCAVIFHNGGKNELRTEFLSKTRIFSFLCSEILNIN